MRYLFPLSLVLFSLFACKKADHDAPVLMLLGNDTIVQWLPASAGMGYFLDPGFTARDNEDGDLTGNVAVLNPVNPNRKGVYRITYTVQDEAGNVTTKERMVYIVNAMEHFAGSYSNCRDTCTASNNIYTASVMTSDTVNRLVRLVNFSNYSHFIWATMTDSTISIAQGQYLDTNSVNFINGIFTPPTGVLSALPPTRFRIKYSMTDGMNGDTCTTWFQR